jgi:hypothetical protein
VSKPNHAQTPADARGSQRALVRRCGWFVRAVGEQLRECTVWDESESGARIIVDAPETVPDVFHIYMTLDFSSRPVAWCGVRKRRSAWNFCAEIRRRLKRLCRSRPADTSAPARLRPARDR